MPTSDAHQPTEPDHAVPNEDEVAAEFPHGTGEPLREQMPLEDADGDDVRQYTGEPVETEDGWVLPQQTVVGSQRDVGGGEWPADDPKADADGDTVDTSDNAADTADDDAG